MTKLLLVEDNEMNRDMLSRRLARRGYHVVTAADGQEALDVARRSLPDLILMDLNLPGLDGWSATRALKSITPLRHTPVLALTAHAMPGDRDKAQASGCDAYETKPVEFARLCETIERLLAGRTSLE